MTLNKSLGSLCSLIKETIDIVEFCEESYNAVFIESTNGWYNTNCLIPEHEDLDPSFGVNREKATFKCFSCGENGSVIDLVMKIEKISLTAAVDLLLSYLNIQVDPSTQKFMAIKRMLKSYSNELSKDVLLSAKVSQIRKDRDLIDPNEYYDHICKLFNNYNTLEYSDFKNFIYYDN